MYQHFLTAVLTVALLGWAGAVQADPVIYDNGAATSISSQGSFLSDSQQFLVADDFVLPSSDLGWRVTDVHWDGFEGPNFGMSLTSFRIIFYEDDAGMPTGGGTADPTSTAFAVRDVTAMVMDSPNSDNEIINSYWADIDPVALDGETTYWISVVGLLDDQTVWDWSDSGETGNSVLGGSEAPLSYWIDLQPREHVFSLTGREVAVPAPGAALLAMLGLPAIGWVKRRLA